MSEMYLRGRQAFGEGLDWREADVKASLVDATYEFSDQHASLEQITTVGDAQDVWGRSIPNGRALTSDDPIAFDTPYGVSVNAMVFWVDTIPLVYLRLERPILTNGGEIEVTVPQPVFEL